MASDFETTCCAYRQQVLDAIKGLIHEHPFSAVTLACCAIDLLAHTLHDPPPAGREDAFMKTVGTKLSGYGGEGIPDVIYSLRCGLVHEYRTKGEVAHAALSGEFMGEPRREGSVVIVSARHFCEAVCTAFERLFRTKDLTQQRAFIARAFIHVMELQMPRDHDVRMLNSADEPSLMTYTGTPAASATGGPFPPALNYNDEWLWRDEP